MQPGATARCFACPWFSLRRADSGHGVIGCPSQDRSAAFNSDRVLDPVRGAPCCFNYTGHNMERPLVQGHLIMPPMIWPSDKLALPREHRSCVAHLAVVQIQANRLAATRYLQTAGLFGYVRHLGRRHPCGAHFTAPSLPGSTGRTRGSAPRSPCSRSAQYPCHPSR